jgi:cytochrome c oxidase assembly protein subunit 15
MTSVARKAVGLWLLSGCLMVFFQVMVGGVTRLTESGLSITEWKPIKGIIPPLNEQEWNAEFDLYKQKVQYQIINEGMSLEEFKGIYFWEYFHRLWARLMFLTFVIPLPFFLFKKYVPKTLGFHLLILFLMAALQGFVGWIMVKAGLTGVFVPPLRLTVHLILALLLYVYLIWLTLSVFRPAQNFSTASKGLKQLSVAIFVVLFFQIFLGGILSGMKAGLAYPSWPQMNGQWIPSALFSEKATIAGFLEYIPGDYWGKTLIQFLHRATAYTLIILIFIFFFKARGITNDKLFKTGLMLLPFFVFLQACIGIITVLNCVGRIPVFWGVLHQAGAMVLIAATVFIIFHLFSKQQAPQA